MRKMIILGTVSVIILVSLTASSFYNSFNSSYETQKDYLGTIINTTNIGSTYSNNERTATRTSDGKLHVVYTTGDDSINVWYACSSDNGATWTNTKISTNDTLTEFTPCISSDSENNIHVVWAEGSGTVCRQLRYREYDGSWGTIENLSNNYDYAYYEPSLAVDSHDNLHLVYLSNCSIHNTYLHPYHMETVFGEWQTPEQIINTSYSVEEPTLAIDYNDYLHVACRNKTLSYDLLYINKTNKWNDLITVSEPTYFDFQTSPSIAIDSENNIHLSWIAHEGVSLENRGVIYCNYTTQWNTPINITDISNSWSSLPFLSVDINDTVHLMFYGNFTGTDTWNLRYVNSSNWNSVINLTNYGNNQKQPHLIFSTNPSFVISNEGYAFSFIEQNSTFYNVSYYSSDDLYWSSSYSLDNLLNPNTPTNFGNVTWNGETGSNVWTNETDPGGTMEINLTLYGQKEINEVRVWCGDIDTSISASNITLYVSSDNSSFNSSGSFLDGGSNISINSSTWPADAGVDPFSINNETSIIYCRFLLSIPTGVSSGLYYQFDWKVYIGRYQ